MILQKGFVTSADVLDDFCARRQCLDTKDGGQAILLQPYRIVNSSEGGKARLRRMLEALRHLRLPELVRLSATSRE